MILRRPVLLNLIKKYISLFIILLIFVLAEVFFWVDRDADFPIHLIIQSVAVAVVFFSSGLGLKFTDILAALKLWQLHGLIQFLNFIMTPILVRFGMFFIPLIIHVDKWITTGFFAVSCIPPPIASAVLLTKASHGNEAVAVVNSILGVLIGIILTPLLLLFHVGLSSTMPVLETLANLLATAIAPFLFGLLAQNYLCPVRCVRFKSFLPHAAFILMIFSSFCEIFGQIDLIVSAYEVLSTLVLVIIMQTVMIYLNLRVALEVDSAKRLSAPDFIAVIFCSTHKSLTLGLPLLITLYGGYSHLSQISLPLLIYHPVQLLIGALLSPYALEWISTYFELN